MSTHVVLCSTCDFKMFPSCVGDLSEQTLRHFYKIESGIVLSSAAPF